MHATPSPKPVIENPGVAVPQPALNASHSQDATLSGAAKRSRGRPRLDPIQRRERILAAAAGLFIDQGFAETSIGAISEKCGVTKRTVYELVGDKQCLFREITLRFCRRLADFKFLSSLAEMPLRDILSSMAHTVLEEALAPEAISLGRMVTIASRQFPELAAETMDAGMMTVTAAVGAIFGELVTQGRIAPIDPAAAAAIFYDTVVGNRPLRAIQGRREPHPTQAEVDERVDVVFLYFSHRKVPVPGRQKSR